jgi:undecaprenyl-phosphate 4-deoxy-4-formamido-L-arabinose transferase
MTPDTPHLSVVVPCYRDAAILPETHRRLRAVLDAIGRRHEIIYVDDGSPDGTRGALRALHAGDPGHVVMLGLARNFGQHAAISAGLAAARGEVVVTIDSDLETPPEEIPGLLAALADGADIACGKRAARDQSMVRALGSRVISGLLSRDTGVHQSDYGCMLRAYRRDLVQRMLGCGDSPRYLPALASLFSKRAVEVEISLAPAVAGKAGSRYSLLRLARVAMDIATGYTRAPSLMLWASAATLGAVSAAILAGALAAAGQARLALGLAGTVLAVGALLMAGLAVLAECAQRLIVQSQGRPLHVVDERLGGEAGAGGPVR